MNLNCLNVVNMTEEQFKCLSDQAFKQCQIVHNNTNHVLEFALKAQIYIVALSLSRASLSIHINTQIIREY